MDGAIFRNFRNRDELFMALAEVHWPPIKPEFSPGSSFAEKMRALAEATIAAIPERRMAAAGPSWRARPAKGPFQPSQSARSLPVGWL
jgi:hypothetical protein